MIKVAVVGALGYAGKELIDILLQHPDVSITVIADKMEGKSKPISDVFSDLKGKLDLECKDLDVEEISSLADTIFLALPHKVSQEIVIKFSNKAKKIIDLSADFRLDDVSVYEKWYQTKHLAASLNKKVVYGLPELHKQDIEKAAIIANPGCYPTSIILGCAPLIANAVIDTSTIIADSKSGYSGAGRNFVLDEESAVSFKAYSVGIHRHTPEIEQELSKINKAPVKVSFTPHLIPVERGILSTIYSSYKKDVSQDEVVGMFKSFYDKKPFVRVLESGKLPETKNVIYTNYCEIGVVVDERTGRIVVVTAIDNLVKGASGQAVHNMNIMHKIEETKGLGKRKK
ncbi:MAG: N-acetyl-gamma-glutamyl-phosphate reductase [bacterium]